jgi:hypothetical protein
MRRASLKLPVETLSAPVDFSGNAQLPSVKLEELEMVPIGGRR